jgi:hypothetical protein
LTNLRNPLAASILVARLAIVDGVEVVEIEIDLTRSWCGAEATICWWGRSVRLGRRAGSLLGMGCRQGDFVTTNGELRNWSREIGIEGRWYWCRTKIKLQPRRLQP